MRRIKETSKLLPVAVGDYNIRFINSKDFTWFLQYIRTEEYSRYMDYRIPANRSDEKMRIQLMDLVISYKVKAPIAGCARCIVEDSKTKEPVGTFSIFEKEGNTIELGYSIVPALWGKGITTKIISELSDKLLELPDVDEILLEIREDNIASRRVAEKSNFDILKKVQGKYRQNIIYSKKVEI